MSELDPNRANPETAQHFARSRGGRCLSIEVTSEIEMLRWECARGHTFEASLKLTRHAGYWCPTCAPNVVDQSGWNYDEVVESDPLLARFHTKLRY